MRQWLLRLSVAAFMLGGVASAQQLDEQNDGLSAAEQRIADFEAEITCRIVGGVVAKEKAWPWQVIYYLKTERGYIYCGGSIIDQKWILTAAHCTHSLNPSDYSVYEGTNTIAGPTRTPGHKLKVQRVIPHEGYNKKTHENDIALIELANKATSKVVQLSAPQDGALEKPGTLATVTGWGTLRALIQGGTVDLLTNQPVRPGDPKYFTNRLMQVDIPLVDEATCRGIYGSTIDHRSLCAGLAAGGKDSCQGDSGGPLVTPTAGGGFAQIGVVSFGKHCAMKDGYGVYTRVSAFDDWIHAKTGISKPLGPGASAPAPPPPVAPPPSVKPTANNKAGLSIGFVQGNTLKPGQSIQFTASAQMSGHLILIDFTPDGKATQIYPNRRSLSASKLSKSNRLQADRQLVVPDPNNPYEGFEFKAEPPTGEGFLLAILSAKPLSSVDLPSLPKTMERPDSLEYVSNIIDELKRDLALSTDAGAQNRAQDWSYVISPYKIVP
jgi:hypothetical protein